MNRQREDRDGVASSTDGRVAAEIPRGALCANMTETSCVTAISEQGGKENQHGNDERFCSARCRCDRSMQVYDDYFVRRQQGVRESANTVDFDFAHHLQPGARNDVVWGLGYRAISDQYTLGFNVTFLPPHHTENLFSTFFEDEIKVTSSLSLTLGSKFEHNAYTGFEFEPGAQLVWNIFRRNALWASAARAIRQPSRRDYGIDADLAVIPLNYNNYGVLELRGNPQTISEQLKDFELGYRTQLGKSFSIDAVAFLSFYRRLASVAPGTPFFTTQDGTPHLVLPLVLGYGGRSDNHGAEIFAHWSVNRRWQLIPGFSWLNMGLADPGQGGITVRDTANSPTRSFQLRSSVNLTRRLEWDASLSSVSHIGSVPGYARPDTRLGWRVGESFEVSIVGQNLLTPRHFEFPDQYSILSTPVERSVSVKVTVRF